MPPRPRRKFNKDNSTTFNVVHRAQNDPLIHDSDANQFVFAEKSAPRRHNDEDEDEDEDGLGLVKHTVLASRTETTTIGNATA